LPTYTLRADLIAANTYQRLAASLIESKLTKIGQSGRLGEAEKQLLRCAAEQIFDAAAIFIRESRRRDPQSGELVHPTEGLPKDDQQ
jgi:hypothetical protein